jgi:hypothetical protein
MADMGEKSGLPVIDERDILEQSFPKLAGGNGYQITSDASFIYNCLAWVIGDTKYWWDIDRRLAGYYWHPNAPREFTLAAWRKIFKDHGYIQCDSDKSEAGFEKIAAYQIPEDDEPSHAARQLESGKWTSKLGSSHDIEHDSLDLLEGDAYGEVVLIMKRPRQDWKK